MRRQCQALSKTPLARSKKLQSEGKLDKAKGSAHNIAGDIKDTAKTVENNNSIS